MFQSGVRLLKSEKTSSRKNSDHDPCVWPSFWKRLKYPVYLISIIWNFRILKIHRCMEAFNYVPPRAFGIIFATLNSLYWVLPPIRLNWLENGDEKKMWHSGRFEPATKNQLIATEKQYFKIFSIFYFQISKFLRHFQDFISDYWNF